MLLCEPCKFLALLGCQGKDQKMEDARSHAPITPTFPSSSSREIAKDYVEKYILAHHFSHYYSQRCL